MKDRPVRIKPVFWMASSRKDLKAFPEPVQSDVGYALFATQQGIATPQHEINLGPPPIDRH